MTGTYRSRSTRVEAIRVPRSIEINREAPPTQEEVDAAARPIVQFLGQSGLRSEHATVRTESRRLLVMIHQRPAYVGSAAGGDWLVKDEYGVYRVLDDRTFRAFYEPAVEASDSSPTVIEAIPLIETVLRDVNAALEPAGYHLSFDLSPILPAPAAEAEVARRAMRDFPGEEPELPQDPTGVDCFERYESPADQA